MKPSLRRRVVVLACGLVLLAVLGEAGFVLERLGPFEARTRHRSPVYWLDLSRDGARLFSVASQNCQLLVTDLTNPFDRRRGPRKLHEVDALRGTMSSDGRFAFVVRDDPTSRSAAMERVFQVHANLVVELFDLDEWRSVRVLDSGNPWGMTFTPDARSVAWISSDSLRIVRVPEGSEVLTRHLTLTQPMAVAFTRDGALVAVGGYGRVVVLDVATGRQLRDFQVHPLDSHCHWLAFAPDGKTLVDSRYDGVRAIDPATGAEKWHHVRQDGGSDSGVVYAPNGRLVFVPHRARQSNLVYVLDAFTGKLVSAPQPWTSVAFAADGSTAAAGHEDGSVEVSGLEAFLSRFR